VRGGEDVEIIIKGEPNEIAALVLAAQEQQTHVEGIDVKKLIAEINRATQEAGKAVLLV